MRFETNQPVNNISKNRKSPTLLLALILLFALGVVGCGPDPKIAELEKKNHELNGQIETLVNEKQDTEESKKKLQDDLNIASTENKKLGEEKSAQKKAQDQLNIKLRKIAGDQIKPTQADLDNVKKQIAELEVKIKAEEAAQQELTDQLKTTKTPKVKATLNGSLNSSKLELATYKEDRVKYETDRKSLEGKLNDLKTVAAAKPAIK